MRRLQLLLAESARNDTVRNELIDRLEAMGCVVTGVGLATVSIRISESTYRQFFPRVAGPSTGGSGPAPEAVPKTAKAAEAGCAEADPAPARPTPSPPVASFDDMIEMPVPGVLRPYLASISEAPDHHLFGAGAKP